MVTNINVDTSPPLVAVTGAVDGTTYQLNQLPAPVCVTSDATSGITSTAMLSLTRTPSGVYTATCSGATDRADNTTPPVSITYTVVATTTDIPDRA